jgi:diguanylate cyclase
MDDRTAVGRRLPVRASPYGPFNELSLHVHRLVHRGRAEQALTAADEFEFIARVFGDERTVGYVMQGRMLAHRELSRYAEAAAVLRELLARHQAAGNIPAGAKAQAVLAGLCFLSNQFADGMRYLAQAGLTLDTASGPLDQYLAALATYGTSAGMAGLYETAGAAYERG